MNRPHSLPLPSQVVGLIAWLLLTFAVAAVGAFASAGAGEFYLALVHPDWAPPPWLFGPVWSVLYVFMGVSAWLVWRRRGFARARISLILFAVQLAANGLWTWLFFVWHQGALALSEVLLLWCLIFATMVLFSRVSKLAAALLIPYLAWVSFATALTFSLWRLNPGALG